ncbi:MAG: hypothetical protein UGE23_00480 [Peptococcaceae bacterium]|nr:hypothetical protein [Peptococcaceae bacterium]
MKRGQIVGVVVVAVIVLCFLVMVWAPELWPFWSMRTYLFDFFATPQGMVAQAGLLFAIGIAQVIVLIWAARRARSKSDRRIALLYAVVALVALVLLALAAWTRMENGTILMLLFGWLALILFGCVVVALAGAMQVFTEKNDDER